MRIKSLLALLVLGSLVLLPSVASAATTHWVNDDVAVGSNTSCTDPGFNTIQAAVTAAAAGDTVHVCDGTYAEQVTIDTPDLSVIGEGATTVVAPASGTAFFLNGNADGLTMDAMWINAANVAQHGVQTDAVVDDVTLRNIRISGATQRGIRIFAPGIATNWDLLQMDVSNNVIGMRITGEVYDLTIDDSRFNSNGSGTFGIGLEAFNDSGVAVIDGLTVSDTEFNDNANQKGLYFEMLSNAMFDNIEVRRNGTLASYNAGAGLDINLKRGGYENITIQDSVIADNGHAAAGFGGGLTIKARDDAPSYNGDPATLDGVWVTNTVVTGNAPDGIRFGEPGKTNLGPTDAHVNLSSITNNTGNGLENASVPETDGTCNWWGSASGPGPVGPGTGDEVSSNVDYQPWETSENGPCNGPIVTPPNKDACKKDGWMAYTDSTGRRFKNQGDCVSYVSTGGKNKAAG